MSRFTGVFEHVTSVSFIAGEDLTGDLYRLVKLDTEGKVIKSVANTDLSIGVVAMNPNRNQGSTESSDEQIVQVAMLNMTGIMLGEAGGAIALGDLLHSDGEGRVIDAGGATLGDTTAGDFIVGQAVEAATAAGTVIAYVPMQISNDA